MSISDVDTSDATKSTSIRNLISVTENVAEMLRLYTVVIVSQF